MNFRNWRVIFLAILAPSITASSVQAGTFEITGVFGSIKESTEYHLGVEMGATAMYMGTLDPGDDGYLIQTFMNDNLIGSLDDWDNPDYWGDGMSGSGIYEGMTLTCKDSCAAYERFDRLPCPATYNYKGKGGVAIYHQFSPEIDIGYSGVYLVDCQSDGGSDSGGTLDEDTGGDDPTFGGGDGCEYGCSPIVINLGRGTIRLSGLDDAVQFDIDEDAYAETLSWTERGSEVAFLAYDRDGDGVIGSGSELFGNFTRQPGPQDENRNGFRALAVFDQASLGGNEDGWITADDSVFAELRLWLDDDHDAVSQEHELFTLAEYGIEAIELDYTEHRWRDRHGNEFRYSSRVRFEEGRTTRAVDVFLLSGSP